MKWARRTIQGDRKLRMDHLIESRSQRRTSRRVAKGGDKEEVSSLSSAKMTKKQIKRSGWAVRLGQRKNEKKEAKPQWWNI